MHYWQIRTLWFIPKKLILSQYRQIIYCLLMCEQNVTLSYGSTSKHRHNDLNTRSSIVTVPLNRAVLPLKAAPFYEAARGTSVTGSISYLVPLSEANRANNNVQSITTSWSERPVFSTPKRMHGFNLSVLLFLLEVVFGTGCPSMLCSCDYEDILDCSHRRLEKIPTWDDEDVYTNKVFR